MMKYYLGLGTNMGELRLNLDAALAKLNSAGSVIRESTRIVTAPWGKTDQPDFLNSIVEYETELSPKELIAALKHFEKDMGRVDTEKWGQRIIDMDILFSDIGIFNSEDIVIPHPHLQKREFVLRSMLELQADLVHPVLKKSISQLYDELPQCEKA